MSFADIRRPAIPKPRNPDSMANWCKQTSDNIDRINQALPAQGSANLLGNTTLTGASAYATLGSAVSPAGYEYLRDNLLYSYALTPTYLICNSPGAVLVTANALFSDAAAPAGTECSAYIEHNRGPAALNTYGQATGTIHGLGGSCNLVLTAIIEVSKFDALRLHLADNMGFANLVLTQFQARYLPF